MVIFSVDSFFEILLRARVREIHYRETLCTHVLASMTESRHAQHSNWLYLLPLEKLYVNRTGNQRSCDVLRIDLPRTSRQYYTQHILNYKHTNCVLFTDDRKSGQNQK